MSRAEESHQLTHDGPDANRPGPKFNKYYLAFKPLIPSNPELCAHLYYWMTMYYQSGMLCKIIGRKSK